MMNLESYVQNGGGMSDEKGMLKAIQKFEKKDLTWQDEFLLGIAYRNFAAWHRHSDDNLPFLEKSVLHLKKALEMSKDEPLYYEDNHNPSIVSSWKTEKLEIYSALIEICVGKNARDYELVKKLSEELINKYPGYLPCLFNYAKILYKEKRYDESLKVILDLKNKYAQDLEWRGYEEPKGINDFMGKVLKKLGKINEYITDNLS